MTQSTTRSQRQPSRKTMLYCPNCDFASRINGEWVIHLNTNAIDYECPNCETVIATRHDNAGDSGLTTRHEGGLQFSNAD